MATQTPNHKLIKPEMTDKADISMINPNWDTLDTALKAVEDRVESTETRGINVNLTSQIVKATDSPVVDLHLVRNGNTIYFQCTSKIKNGWGNLGITLPSEARPVVITPLSASFSVESDPAKFGHAIVIRSGAVNTLSLSEMTTAVTLSGTWIV